MIRARIALIFLAVITFALVPPAGAQMAGSSKKPTSPDDKSDSNLSRELHHQLQVLPFYSVFDHITFTLNGSTVTLTGQVLRPTLKGDAEAAAKSLEGVDTVANQIELLPTSPGDDDLRRAIYRAIYEDSTLARYAVQTVPAIHIVVKNGTVALEGNVDSPTDKTLAASRAGGVAKVSGLRNNLIVQARASGGK